MQERERRYPPSPYPPRSDETRRYRDAWDLGWRHYGSLRSQVLEYEAGLSDGPARQGYRDGVLARFSAEERAREAERRAKLADRERDRERWRLEGEAEAPW